MDTTKPNSSYKRSAYLAVAGLLAFVLVYFGLAAWFLHTAWRLIRSASHSADGAFLSYIGAAVALLLAAFMLKALFAVRNAMPDGLEEVTAKQQPRLFAYLHELADAAGAPRPHRVFVSNRVNAAVFYDLSLFNLIFPTRKNLEIGLPLVNSLPLGELRAVLAHEFGHFAQRSMAVGRWVYLAQQIVQQTVARRDKFDSFITGLGRIDVRLLIVAWALQLVVWSVRSLVESAFHLLVMVQSALSREMEMQADLVAVSLTGSDALIHALYRLRAVDDAWERTIGFALTESSQGKPARDVYALQRQIAWRMSAILDDASYGNVPPVPEADPQQHRVFKPELGQPPKMWQSHPQNHEREQNAKRQYIAARIDQSSSWLLFDNTTALREKMTLQLLGAEEGRTPVAAEESLERLKHYYGREQYHGRYCGIYFGRRLTMQAATPGELRAARQRADAVPPSGLYPPALAEDVRQLRQLQAQSSRAGALISGHLALDGGKVQLDGRHYRRRELPALKAQLDARVAGLEQRLWQHDAQCRRAHYEIAQQIGQGWPAYLDSLLDVLHYAEHTAADLTDAYGLVQNSHSVVVAVRRQSKANIEKLIEHCMALRDVLEAIYRQSTVVELDADLAARMEMTARWAATLGEFDLAHVSRENINEWLHAAGNWVRYTENWLHSLRAAALERLLLSEVQVMRMRQQAVPAAAAPAPCRAPPHYAVLVPGAERKLQTSLGWWARFQRADGWLAGGARLAVAGVIVAGVLAAGMHQGDTKVMVFNGLGTTVDVEIDGNRTSLAPGSHVMMSASADETHKVEARNGNGVIERFSAKDGDGLAVYNVAAAAPLVKWTAVYGSSHNAPAPQILGAQRWLATSVDVLFTEPPKSVSSRSGSQRTVLDSIGGEPAKQLEQAGSDAQREAMLLAHATWDNLDSPRGAEWLRLAFMAGHPEVLARRLQAQPEDVSLRRLEQDAAKQSPQICATARERAAARPDDGDRFYLALRCNGDAAVDASALSAAMARWPRNIWLKYMKMRELMEKGELLDAEPLAQQLIGKAPYGGDDAELELARVQRYTRGQAVRSAIAAPESYLRWAEQSETERAGNGVMENAYAALNKGQMATALAGVSNERGAEARMQRLAGASDGAAAMQMRRVLEMPLDQGLDQATVFTSAALALRMQRDPAPYFKASEPMFGDMAPKLQQFLLLANKGRVADAERALTGVPVVVRGMAYSAGVVLMGPMAPREWRKGARTLLFAPERPYFRA